MSAVAFRYKGYSRSGERTEGEITATTVEEAERKVSGQDIVITSIQPVGRSSRESADVTSKLRPRSKKRISDADAALILKNWALMVEMGVPFLEALDAVEATADAATKEYLAVLRVEVVAGKGLSQAIRSVPKLFPPLVSDMIRVAEDGGKLEQALFTSATYLQRAADLRRKVINAMVYPIVMLSVSVLTVFILVLFVMPRFATIFKTMKVKLPLTTQVMLGFGDIVRAHPAFIVMGVAIGFAGLIYAIRNSRCRALIAVMAAHLPLIGDLLKRLALSRAMMSMGTLLQANVSLMVAMEHGANMAGHRGISEALLAARRGVEQGAPLSDSLEQSKLFPSMVIQLIKVGERTGRLHTLMTAGAVSLEEEADARLKTLVALIEPAMIVVMGLVVGTITVSIISPIYSVVENVR